MFRLILLLGTAFITISTTECVLLDFMTADDIKRYFDISTIDKVPQYDIVSPYVHEADGRRKRDLEIEVEIKEIKLEAFGEKFHMRLKENKHIIADGLEVEQYNANGTIERLPLRSRRCFYIGQLLSHNVSRVAVSTCQGMMGIIAMEKESLYIRPLNDKHAKEYRRRRRDIRDPHIIYRRNANEDISTTEEESNAHFCGLDKENDRNGTFHDAVKRSKHKAILVQKETTKHVINKRAAPCPVKYLEVRVAVDRDMVNYYGQGVIEYALMLMNTVAARFAEPSLGTLVNIHIVKLETLTTDTFTDEFGNSLVVTADGERTLESWTDFQLKSYIYDDTDSNHWDLAVMITRKNLHAGGNDGLEGIAFSDGTCDASFSGALAQDNGFSSGQTIAHEIGHTLGIDHDGFESNAACPDTVNLMSSSITHGTGAFRWSSCSQREFDTFTSKPQNTCIDDVPPTISAHSINAGLYPGYQLTTNEQCRSLSDKFISACDTNALQLLGICERLICQTADQRCYYQVPAAEGTICGPGMWCVSGECVGSQGQFPSPINGGWSSWGLYSQCSRTCGGGVRIRERCCDNPVPRNSGSLCQGKSSETELCNTMGCTTSQPQFAHDQCMATNNEPWRDNFYTWEAYFSEQTEQELCAFKCLNNINWVVSRGPFFQDGSRCSVGGKNELLKCVNGQCVEFGCDGKLDSTQKYDACRQCGGDGSSCSLVTGFYTNGEPFVLTSFLDIPSGATTIEITNTNVLSSFMAMKVTSSSQYIFGNGRQPLSGEYPYGGIFVKYFFEADRELIFIEGPTPADFTVQVYRVNRQQNPTITYSYYMPSGQVQPRPVVPTPPPNYWRTTMGDCSVTCGTGIMEISAKCFSPSTGTNVADNLCDSATRPATSQQACILTTCPTMPPPGPTNYWVISDGTCSATCGYGVVEQNAHCYSPSSDSFVDNSLCDPGAKPDTTPRSCYIIQCPPPNYWLASEGQCSKTCGFGVSVKSSRCFSPSLDVIVANNLCDATTRPAETEHSCYLVTCPAIWLTFPYGNCDATCGTAYQTRTVWCAIVNGPSHTQVLDSECTSQPKPQETIPCDVPACGVWDVGELSSCSVTCGDGFQRQSVVCRPEGYESYPNNPPSLSETSCRSSKPPTQLPCNLEECPGQPTDHEWALGSYGECDATCGEATRTRVLLCVTSGQHFAIVDADYCANLPQPSTNEPCYLPQCPSGGVWEALQYTECSSTCGDGLQNRRVLCRQTGYEDLSNPPILPNTQCSQEDKPESQRTCNAGDCPTPESGREYLWLPGNWETCDATCGNAVRTRTIWCFEAIDSNYQVAPDENLCSGLPKPHASEPCEVPDCSGGVVPDDGLDPDKGTICAGLYQHAFNKLDRISFTGDGKFCNETIVAPLGQTIRLNFHQCNIQCDEGDEAAIRDNHRRYPLCCKEDTFVWTSVSNIVQLEHKTRSSGHGYEVSVEFIGNAISTGCDKILTSDRGAVSSPSYPSAYPSDQQCLTTIIAPAGKKVQLNFQSFDMTSDTPWAPKHCFHPSDDNIEIFDLDTNTGTRYCGKFDDASELKTTPLNSKVLIKFKSNNDGMTSNGFLLDYNLVNA